MARSAQMTTATYTTLISAEQLRSALESARPPIVIDVSFDLNDVEAGEASWGTARLPGSFYLHLDRDLCGARFSADGAFRGRHPLPEQATFATTLGRCGVAAGSAEGETSASRSPTPQTQVVVLDRQGSLFAARLWWMLRWMGHSAVAVLDGGLGAWVAAGGALAAGKAPAATGGAPYPEREPLVETISMQALASRLGRIRLIDARAGERFRGEVEPLDRVAGHIPGAHHRFFKDNLDADGRFRPAPELLAAFGALLGRPAAIAPNATPTSAAGTNAEVLSSTPSGDELVVHQCGSGVSACHNLLAMTHAGLRGSVLYPGSWSEWSSDPGRPVAQG